MAIESDYGYGGLDADRYGCSEYYWTVRAEFDLDGQNPATECAGVFGSKGQYAPWSLREINPGSPGVISAEQLYVPFKIACN